MTKSEARSIMESCNRALRMLQGTDMPYPFMTPDVSRLVVKNVQGSCDEIQRVLDMAKAELEKK